MLFEYTVYGESPITRITGIEAKQPEILYVNTVKPLVLDCNSGQLRLDYEFMSVTLDTGENVSDSALVKACEDYWQRFQSGS